MVFCLGLIFTYPILLSVVPISAEPIVFEFLSYVTGRDAQPGMYVSPNDSGTPPNRSKESGRVMISQDASGSKQSLVSFERL